MAIFLLSACKKDKFTTAPQISFKSISPNVVDNISTTPILTIHVTDAEGDLGLVGKDTAFIYMKNLLTNTFDSVRFPNLQAVAKSNFKADVDIDIAKVLRCKSLPNGALHTDTLYFQVYIKDFAKNKSNVIVTDDPVYYICR